MEQRKKIPFSYSNNNIPRNLFGKANSFKENRKYPSKDKNNKIEETLPNPKLIKSLIYFPKIVPKENKKEQMFIQRKFTIDSKTDARLPQGYIDLSYDNPINE